MSKQLLNEKTFEAPAVSVFTQGKPVTRRMTYAGSAARSLLLIAITIAFAMLGWRSAADVVAASGLWFFLGYILLIALSVAAAANPRLAPVAGLLYAVLMGLWMGAISRIYEAYYDGVVGQALLASVATFIACLLLYMFRVVHVTGRFVRVVIIATLGVAIMYFAGWIFSLFGVDLLFWTRPTSVGIVVGILVCIVAALNLILDFAVIETGVNAGAPAAMSWFAAFGLLTTLVWLYIEILYLLVRIRAVSQ
ncbi:MAG TPA: Bax inhibitor-1/YccA family protein [Actinomycetota bacterium]|nr:Bax inhibitor-1/YccA family protein [Actinomycetota bacterium]